MSKQILVFLVPEFADWELGLVLPGVSQYFGAEIVTASLDGGTVRSAGRLRVEADRVFSEVEPEAADLLILPGSELWNEGPIAPVTEAVRRRAAAGRPTAAICAATTALGHAGLLDDRPHTSNSLDFLASRVPSYRGQAHYQDRPCVRDELFITAPGTAPVAFAAEVSRLIAPDQEAAIAEFQREFAREHR